MRAGAVIRIAKAALLLVGAGCGLLGVFWAQLPPILARGCLLGACCVIPLAVLVWGKMQRRQAAHFANDLCETADALMEGREPPNFLPYEDSVASRAQSKLMQYYDKMRDAQQQSQQDKQALQGLVSDISHQVKTPVANLQLFTGILRQHQLPPQKQAEFLSMIAAQANKLDFLMQSLIKVSRLEAGTFALQVQACPLEGTIAQAVSGVWAKAEAKGIQLEVDCDSQITVKHDPKWTAEALGNLLDNAIKYTPPGGSVRVQVRPWQFYTRIDVADTGIGIAPEHYNDVFQRFYRGPQAAAEEGVGLGLYLARGIITRQKGYISVKSQPGQGATFSVYLLS